jgi:hypothetical protein
VDRTLAGLLVPTLDQIMQCVMRCNLDQPGMMEIFMVYVDVFLPKIAMSECWSREQRLNSTISEAKLPNGKPAIPPQTEAYLLTVWANGYLRWKYIVEKQQKEEQQDRKCIAFQVPFCSDKMGQARWGGWQAAGIDFYKEACKLCKEDGRHGSVGERVP